MEVFRICKSNHASLSSSSGIAGRWNLNGEYVLYTAGSRALAALEILAGTNAIGIIDYSLMVISAGDDLRLQTTVAENELPSDWRSITAYSKLRKIGSMWYQSAQSLLLKVPSAIIPAEHNYIINTRHPDFKNKVKLVSVEKFIWDERLFK